MNTQQLLTDAAERARQMIADIGMSDRIEVTVDLSAAKPHVSIGDYDVWMEPSEQHEIWKCGWTFKTPCEVHSSGLSSDDALIDAILRTIRVAIIEGQEARAEAK